MNLMSYVKMSITEIHSSVVPFGESYDQTSIKMYIPSNV